MGVAEAVTDAALGTMAPTGHAGAPEDRLSAYRQRRDRDHTPEPVPEQGPLPRGNDDTFVIQEHHAQRLHWDSGWNYAACLCPGRSPRGPPEDPAANRVPIRTENHPLEYASFEGEIPPRQYGAGPVRIWDRGTYETEKWTDEEIKAVLHGSRVSGRYVPIHTGGNRPPRALGQPTP
jgi:DNA ligase D-like protein (predicted 3'-phosphoesterase)